MPHDEIIAPEQVLAWDPDYTKLTAKECAELEEAENDSETVPMDAINWN